MILLGIIGRPAGFKMISHEMPVFFGTLCAKLSGLCPAMLEKSLRHTKTKAQGDMQLRRQILRVTILAWLVAHFDHAVTRSGVIPLVFFGYLLHATAPCVVELGGVGVDDVITISLQ